MRFKFLLILLATCQAFGCDANGTHLSSKTLHVGFNGLSEVSKMNFFENKIDIQNSWLKNALTSKELNQLLEHVDFDKQFILIFSIGKRPNLSGKIITNHVKYTVDNQNRQANISTNINIGVVDYEKCNIPVSVESYPFIVELVERPAETFKLVYGGYAVYNFPHDGCKTPIAGKPTLQ
jgi:hypothetical protein